jgi:hypothetical protein
MMNHEGTKATKVYEGARAFADPRALRAFVVSTPARRPQKAAGVKE